MSVVTKFAVVAAAICLTGPAVALSCMPSDVARTYNDLHDRPEKYIVAKGILTFDEKKLPKTDLANQHETPGETLIPGRLKGVSLSKTGFNQPFDRKITVNALCYGPWCAGGQSGQEVLAFLSVQNGKYELALDPCYSNGFVNPTRKMLDKVISCVRGGPCKPDDDFPQ